jgi:RHS repeat-associated protein
MTSYGAASYTYNAEGQLATAASVTYTYDGDGNRVKKSNGTLYWGAGPMLESDGSGTLQREFIYAGGKRIARRDISGGAVYYYFTDDLGSSSVVTTAAGAIDNESDYYPYGGERAYTTTLANQNYKFTGKERDTESGLDNFGARYNASTMGRFMTPDPLLSSGQPWDPQTWNRYSYTLNNPLRYTDPLGLYVWGNCSGDADKCKAEQQRFRDSIAKAQQGLKGLDPNSKEAKALQKTLNKLGEEGKGNIKINFGDAGKTDGHHIHHVASSTVLWGGAPALYHVLVLSANAASPQRQQARRVPENSGTDAKALPVCGRRLCDGQPTQAFLWLVWGSSTNGQSLVSHCGTRPQNCQISR